MVTAYDVEPAELISRVADKLKKDIEMPDWAKFVKTGPQATNVPQQEDWWWIRAASILRKVYTDGPVGVNRLRVWYGGRKNRGSSPEKFVKAGGKIIRTLLQELGELGYVSKTKQGRKITPEGRKFMDSIAFEVKESES